MRAGHRRECLEVDERREGKRPSSEDDERDNDRDEAARIAPLRADYIGRHGGIIWRTGANGSEWPDGSGVQVVGMNRLARETSPYLRQHAANPVDWYPWGTEALGRARSEGRPILLSIGYAACHWCHVMAHESFEDPETAALMNELFVNIKVDREERPDLDAIYMSAVQAMTGQGGWPMTVFLTPDGVPFYGGTF
jgi:hypothetical protein